MAGRYGQVDEIRKMLGVSRQYVWLVRERRTGFPQAVDHLHTGPLYDLEEVRDWWERRHDQRNS